MVPMYANILVEIKRNLKSGKDTIVTLKTIQECCRVCNKSYFFLCLNLRQYDTFVQYLTFAVPLENAYLFII
jgi:hypothetical protein